MSFSIEIIALDDTIISKTSGKVFDPDVIVLYISFTYATITKHGQQVIYMIEYIIWLIDYYEMNNSLHIQLLTLKHGVNIV